MPIFLVLLALTAPARAKDFHHGPDHNQIDGVRVEAHGNANEYSVLGAGARVEFAVAPDGFIRGNVHDELALSLGADGFFAAWPAWSPYYDRPYVEPLALVQWNFYLGRRWSVFPEAGVAVRVDPTQTAWVDPYGHTHAWIYPETAFGVGARYHFNGRAALLLRVSKPGGLQVGVTF